MLANCADCKSPGCDLRLSCGCSFHVICLPLSLVLDTQTEPNGTPIGPSKNGNARCPTCTGGVQGIQLFPLGYDALKRSIELRVEEAKSSGRNIYSASPIGSDTTCGVKRDRDSSNELLEVEAAHAVFAQGKHGASRSADGDASRTGRWTEEEVDYVDFLIKAFDKGQLPLSHGTKLSAFLCDALLCKPSRLTKKMKNAKLSTRIFQLQSNTLHTNSSLQDAHVLKTLQDRFVMSMPTEYSRLEFGFNLAMHWRTCFSDLCVQIGYPFLNGSSFIASLEDYERLASNADEGMRNVRRRRIVGSFGSSSSGAEAPPKTIDLLSQVTSKTPTSHSQQEPAVEDELRTEAGIPSIDAFIDRNDQEFFAGENFHDSLTGIFETEVEDREIDPPPHVVRSRRDSVSQEPFLEVITNYLQELDLPFQHADVWVPSFVNSENDDDVRLLHAGNVTRQDQDGELWSAFESFGAYSRSFSFTPGKGLVGRVYTSGKTMWEFGLNKLDPEFFFRAGGAEEYGVRTAVGIPFSTSGVGRMVVILYSCKHIPEDAMLAFQFAQELAKYAPAPKWKLVVEMSGDASQADQVHSTGERRASIDEIPPPGQETFSRASNTALVSPLETPQSTVSDEDDVQNIISLLGEQLAIQSSHDFEDPNLFQELMRIRLLLLRPTNRRSSEENDKIDVLRYSYRNYSAGNRRSGKELATLLAKEWLCLSDTLNCRSEEREESPQTINHDDVEPNPLGPQPSSQYVSHEFAPSVKSPLNSCRGSGPNVDKAMMAPPLQLHGSFKNTSGNFEKPDKSVVVIDHSMRNLPSFPNGQQTPFLNGQQTPFLNGQQTPFLNGQQTPFPNGQQTPFLNGQQKPAFCNGLKRTVSCGIVPSQQSDVSFGNHVFQRTNSFLSNPTRGQSHN